MLLMIQSISSSAVNFLCRMQFLLVVVAFYVGGVYSWDIATTSGDDTIHFFKNEILTSNLSIASRSISALTYDEVHNMMLYVDKKTDNDSICGYDLTCKENKCFTQGSGRHIHCLAFDPVTERVFFTDTNDRSIYWISLKRGSENEVNLLLKMDDGIPRDLAVDSCEGYIYWLNTNLTTATIERARFNGAEREVFEYLTTIYANATMKFEPSSLAIDQPTRRMFWLEPVSAIEYRLFNTVLNKTRKPKEYLTINISSKIKEDPANTLTVSKNFVFRLHHDFGIVMSYPKSFDIVENKKNIYSDKKNQTISIVAKYEIKDQIHGCEALSQVEIFRECHRPFCVHGMKVNDASACKCSPGYTGERCDVSVCKNFCLQGTCSVTVEGLPECRCGAGYSGERCHISICENFCLRGNCSVNEEGFPECRCDAGYTGERCEVDTCQGYCLNKGECYLTEEDEPSCECVKGYQGNRCEAGVNNDTVTILVNQRDRSTKYSCVYQPTLN